MFSEDEMPKNKKIVLLGVFVSVNIILIIIAMLYLSNYNEEQVNEYGVKLTEAKEEDSSTKSLTGYDDLYCKIIDRLIESTGVYEKGDYIDKIAVNQMSFKGVNEEEFNNIIEHLQDYSTSLYSIDSDEFNNKGFSKLNVSLYISFPEVNIIDERRVRVTGLVYCYQTNSRMMTFSCSRNVENGEWEFIGEP